MPRDVRAEISSAESASPFERSPMIFSSGEPFSNADAAVLRYDDAGAEFVLRDYHGYVSVFAPDSGRQPVQITAIRTGSLRRADQQLLQNGLAVGSREQLIMLLEDLSG